MLLIALDDWPIAGEREKEEQQQQQPQRGGGDWVRKPVTAVPPLAAPAAVPTVINGGLPFVRRTQPTNPPA